MSESLCGRVHFAIEDAIRHARENLCQDGSQLTRPLWGTRGGQIANVGRVIGYQNEDGRKRFRLDYDPAKGVHVNQEDFTRPVGHQKVVHVVQLSHTPRDAAARQAWLKIQEGQMQLFWAKWTSRYDKPPVVLEAEKEVDRRKRESR
jgi:hypothetical protein